MDEDLYDDIKRALESAAESMANEDAARASSTLGDMDAMDIDDEHGEGTAEKVVVISTYGSSWGDLGIAVDGDVLVSPYWMKKLRLKCPNPNNVCTWAEVGGTGKLTDWLSKRNFDRSGRWGGDDPSGMEIEVWKDHVIERVVMDTGYDMDDVRRVADDVDKRDYFYTSSGDGEIVYWIPPEDDPVDLRSRSRRSMRRRKQPPKRNPKPKKPKSKKWTGTHRGFNMEFLPSLIQYPEVKTGDMVRVMARPLGGGEAMSMWFTMQNWRDRKTGYLVGRLHEPERYEKHFGFRAWSAYNVGLPPSSFIEVRRANPGAKPGAPSLYRPKGRAPWPPKTWPLHTLEGMLRDRKERLKWYDRNEPDTGWSANDMHTIDALQEDVEVLTTEIGRRRAFGHSMRRRKQPKTSAQVIRKYLRKI